MSDDDAESGKWSTIGNGAALAALEIDGVRYAATGSNPARARESLGMILRAHRLDPVHSADAAIVDAPDVGPWSFRWPGGPYVDFSRGADPAGTAARGPVLRATGTRDEPGRVPRPLDRTPDLDRFPRSGGG